MDTKDQLPLRGPTAHSLDAPSQIHGHYLFDIISLSCELSHVFETNLRVQVKNATEHERKADFDY